jgi:hypothetical protein
MRYLILVCLFLNGRLGVPFLSDIAEYYDNKDKEKESMSWFEKKKDGIVNGVEKLKEKIKEQMKPENIKKTIEETVAKQIKSRANGKPSEESLARKNTDSKDCKRSDGCKETIDENSESIVSEIKFNNKKIYKSNE